MKMGDFNCGTLELSFDVGTKDIDTDAIIKEVGESDDKDLNIFLIFDSKENPGKQHSHIGIQTRPDEMIAVRISYHDSPGKAEEDDKPPFMEDCAKWLGKFIKPNKVGAVITATYFFDKSYMPLLKLPYALRTSEKALAGGQVTGLSIQFPADSALDFAIIQRARDVSEFGISISTHVEVAIKKFSLYQELERLQSPVMALVKKRDKRAQQHEKRDEK